MPFIALLGCDGSGKSTVIAMVTERLRADGVAVVQGHWRPEALALERDARKIVSADDPHGQVPRGKLSSVLKLGWLGFHWWVGWWRGLRFASVEGVVLFDRYHADLLVDPRRYRYGGPIWAARLATRWMPQPDLVIFLDAHPTVLLGRKQEVGRDALAHSRAGYLMLCQKHSRFVVVDASRALAEVTKDVLKRISNLA